LDGLVAVTAQPVIAIERRALFHNERRVDYAAETIRGRCELFRAGFPQACQELAGYTTLSVEGDRALMLPPPDAVRGREWVENFCRPVSL
jgi:hypothetical protein